MEENYQKQAEDFLRKTKTTMSIKFLKHDKYFLDDADKRNIYLITLRRGRKIWKFRFGQSIFSSEKGQSPTAYDILASLNDDDVGSFEDFTSEFGYDDMKLSAYPKVKKIYNAIKKEYQKIQEFWTEEEQKELQEIQ